MQFYDVIKKRESIKQFNNTPIDGYKLSRMINAVLMSPSWKDNSSYRFVLIDDESEKNQLAQAIMNDTQEATNSVKQAPMVAVVVADPDNSGKIDDKEYYLVDSAIAMEHFILAATNEGYATCWIASLDEDKVRQTLNIPDNYRVVAMTPIGETSVEQRHGEFKDSEQHVFINTWGNPYSQNNKNQMF